MLKFYYNNEIVEIRGSTIFGFNRRWQKGKFHSLGHIGGGYIVLLLYGLKYELNYIVHPLFYQISYVFIYSLSLCTIPIVYMILCFITP